MKCHNLNCENYDTTQQSGCFLHNKVSVKFCKGAVYRTPDEAIDFIARSAEIIRQSESYDRQDDYETDFEVEV